MDNTPQVVEAAAPAIIPTNPFNTEPAQPRRQFRLPTPGEWMAAWHAGGSDFAQLNANIMAMAPQSPIAAAAGDVTTAEADGILPVPIVGPIYDAVNALRPLVSAVGARALPPSGKVFIRPKIVANTQVAVQASELGALATRTFDVDDVQVTKKTFGGRVLLSEQVIDWSAPSMLDAVLSDLAAEYAMATEAEACAVVEAKVAAGNRGYTPATGTDSAKWIEAFYASAAKIAATSNYLPTHLVVHPVMWGKIGALVDSQKRPLFPYLGPNNASGTQGATTFQSSPLGMQIVVSKEIASAARVIVFNARGFEFYEQQKGAVSINVPDKLAVNLAFRGYFAGLVIDDTKMAWFRDDA